MEKNGRSSKAKKSKLFFDGLAEAGNANQTFISLIIKEIEWFDLACPRCAFAPQNKDEPTLLFQSIPELIELEKLRKNINIKFEK